MPVYGFPDRKSYDNTARAVQRINREVPGSFGPMRMRDPLYGLKAAFSKGTHAAGATQAVYLADSAFAETTDEVDATNDSLVEIPDGTKLYLGRVRPLSGYRIVQAFICEG